ncbi:MAG: TolC family protein [Defluviitaleaceae bacterium]|nr:TolC family protein [Defluviitaleaceae bacterium]
MKKLFLSKKAKYLVCAALAAALVLTVVPVFAANNTEPPKGAAAEAVTKTLTIDDAVKAAINTSSSLQSYNDSIPVTNKKISDLYTSLLDATDLDTSNSVQAQIWQAESSRDAADANAVVTKQQLTLQVWNAFESVASAQNSLTLTDQSLDIQKRQLDISKLKLKLGMMSQNDYNSAESSYNKAVADRATKVTAIDTAFASLNKLMGTSLSTRWNLDFTVDYAPMKAVNLTADIQAACDASPTVKSDTTAVKIAQFQIDTFDPYADTQAQSLDQLNATLNSDKRSLDDAKTSIEQKVTSAYTSIIQQESGYASLQAALGGLQTQLNVAQVQLKLGMTTQLNVDNINLQIAQQEESIRSAAVTHAIAVMQYGWPNTL